MSLPMETQGAFQSLGLSELPSEWVCGVWEQNFCESVTLPVTVEDCVLSGEVWVGVVEACRRWVGVELGEIDEGPSAGFWTTLLDAEVPHRSLMALLYCLMERNKQRTIDRVCAAYAAQVYFTLLQIPGSGAFKIFQPMVFQKALDVFYMFPDNVAVHQQRSVPSIVGGRGRRGKRKRRETEDEVVERGDEESGEGQEELRTLLKQVIMDLLQFLRSHSLSDYETTRYQAIQVMVKLTTAEIEGGNVEVPWDRPGPLGTTVPLCVLSWKCLEAICQPLHGPIESTTCEVFRQLLPSLLMLTADGGACTSPSLPSSLTIPNQHATKFVRFILEKHGDSVVVPLKALVQHICTKVPDRAEYRNRVSTTVVKLLSLFSDELFSQLMEWIYKFSRNTKIGYRVFALDIVLELLNHPLRQPEEGALSDEDEYRLTYKFLVKMVMSRCSDKAPSVRGRALTALSIAANSNNQEIKATVKRTIFSQLSIDPLLVTSQSSPPERVIVAMVRRRTEDEKVGVRKAALQALEGIIRLNLNNIAREDVEAIHKRCLDPALSVRKQALSSLTALTLERPKCAMMHSLWLDGVLPMVMDRETGAQEKCMNLLEEVILSNITSLKESKCMNLLEEVILSNITSLKESTTESHVFVWHLLGVISSEERLDLRRYFRRAIQFWAKGNKLSPSLVTAVCSHTTSKEHLQAAWMILAEVSLFTTTIETKFLIDSWKHYSSSVTTTTKGPLVQILIVIGNMAQNMSKVAMGDLKDQILSLLGSFKLVPDMIQAAVNTICLICVAIYPSPRYQSELDAWGVPLLKSCEEYLSSVILHDSESGSLVDYSEDEAISYLFTLGEVSQLCPAHTSHHLCLMVQSLLLATSEQAGDDSTSSTSGLSRISNVSLSPTLRAHGYITLGKLCLQHEELAKKSIIMMARELQHSNEVAIRNNIIVVLCDLAVRYSTKVDPYIPNITACLCDKSLLVRKQTLTLLAHLIQEDYVKWKGSLFFRFVSTLVDEELKRFSEFCLVHLLLVRYPTVFYQHFVECVFHFNSYEKHRVYNKFKQSESEKQLFSMKGSKNTAKRMTVYTFLLSHMTDEHRFQLSAKLCQEVLGGLVDGALPLDEDSASVVRDTLAILTCKEIKLTSLRRNVGEELADEGDHVGAAMATAQTKIISQIVKRNVIENLVPIVISAKHLFEREHSPLLKDILLYLKELMQDYRHEVSEVLAADRQLAEEIEFDLKRFEEEQKKAAVAQTPLAVTPHAQMVSPLLSPGALGSPAMAPGGPMFTPPRLRREGGSPAQRTPGRAVSILKTKAPSRHFGLSPLVTIQRVRFPKRPLPAVTPLAVAMTTPKVGGGIEDEGERDVSSPAAARKRATMVNSEYATKITTPVVLTKTPKITLQRAVLLKSAQRHAAMPRTELGGPSSGDSDETMIIGRAASTPQGLADSISFNVSSVVPPSPIPPNTTVDSYTRRTRSQSKKKEQVDIMMLSPDTEPRKLDKWKMKVK